MNYEQADWNEQWAVTLTEDQFIERGLIEGKYDSFKPSDQVALLKEAYRLCKVSAGGSNPPGH